MRVYGRCAQKDGRDLGTLATVSLIGLGLGLGLGLQGVTVSSRIRFAPQILLQAASSSSSLES